MAESRLLRSSAVHQEITMMMAELEDGSSGGEGHHSHKVK